LLILFILSKVAELLRSVVIIQCGKDEISN